MISTPDRQHTVLLIQEAHQQGARLQPACEALGIDVRTYQRWVGSGQKQGKRQGQGRVKIKEDQRSSVQRRAPVHALTPAEQQAILEACHRPEWAHLPPEQIVMRLLDEEQRYLASVSSFYRVLRRHGEVHHRGRARAPQRRPHPTTHHATEPNQIWTWDCTWLPGPVKGIFFYLTLIVDIFSRKIVGWEVFPEESAENARAVLERAVLAEQLIDKPLVLHSDNGSPFKASLLMEKIRELGITPSHSRPRVSNDNAYSEALFRTCKYVPDFPSKGFADLTQARQWVDRFTRAYNTEHRHSGIRFVTPEQRHQGKDTAILAQREALYQAAKTRHPSRWSKGTRNWNRVEVVSLNPEREPQKGHKKNR